MTTVTQTANAVYNQPPLLFRERTGDGALHVAVLLDRVMGELSEMRERT
jgi:hypothetical protein